MNIDGSKIKALIDIYGKGKQYDEKSYTPRFCEDFGLNYIQWSSYTRGSQKLGIKIIYILMNIFPNLNLNWLFKDAQNMFTNDENPVINEEKAPFSKKEVTNFDLMSKLEEIQEEIKRGKL
jgi:hypothetical protein